MFDGFTTYDFDLFTRDKWRSDTYNAPRLAVRHKLAALAKPIEAALKSSGVPLVHKTSLNHPSRFNNKSVRMIKAYFARSKDARKSLKQLFGSTLGKDLDPHYCNAQIWIKADVDGIEFSLSLHPQAWWDGENLRKQIETRDSRLELCSVLRPLPDYHIQMHDWRKLYPCEEMQPDHLEWIFKNYKAAEHWLHCYRRMSAEEVVELGADFAQTCHEEIMRLVPVYQFVVWSPERNLIFSG